MKTPSIVVLAAWWMLAGVGCSLSQANLSPETVGQDEQVVAILDIVPLGSDRTQTVSRLEKAGIAGNSGSYSSIYYCNGWKRTDGRYWAMNVALLFDQNDRFYAIRPADSDAALETPAVTSGDTQPDLKTTSLESDEPEATTEEHLGVEPLPEESESPAASGSMRHGRRSPFGEEVRPEVDAE